MCIQGVSLAKPVILTPLPELQLLYNTDILGGN